MKITDIKIRRTYQDTRLRALVSLTFDGELAVHDIKVIEGPERLFVAMPSRRDDNGVFRDIAHPITVRARRELEGAILAAYRQYLAGAHGVGEPIVPAADQDVSPAEEEAPDAEETSAAEEAPMEGTP